jgi:hypothetical protein
LDLTGEMINLSPLGGGFCFFSALIVRAPKIVSNFAVDWSRENKLLRDSQLSPGN